jgi:hypothetical protein
MNPFPYLILDGQADRSREGTLALVDDDALARYDALERIANAHAHADKALQLSGQAGQKRGSACDHDVADSERIGLVLVVLERGYELACKRLELAPNDVGGGGDLLLGDAGQEWVLGAVERERVLDRLGFGGSKIQLARVNSQICPLETAKVDRS